MPKLAVLVSGAGSILRSIIEYPLRVDLLIADRECAALGIAAEASITAHVVDRRAYMPFTEDSRRAFSLEIEQLLSQYEKEDVAAMAGFLTILSPSFFSRYHGTLLNTHPSLLPAFRGNRAVQQALHSGVRETGCTVHVATPKLDDGPILAQQVVPILAGDTEETLHERIKVVERVLYPQTIEKVLKGTP